MATTAHDTATSSKTEPRSPLALAASRDRVSGRGIFPRIPDQSPAAPRFDPITLSPSATLYSYTVIHPNPKTGLLPFALIYADFPENVRVFGRLDLAPGVRPSIGMRVSPVAITEEDGGETYRFVAAEEIPA